MKKIVYAIISLMIIANTAKVYADYPIVSHRFIADPGTLVYNGRVYVYCSNDDENVSNTSYQMSSIVCVSSSDMKNWTDHGVVFDVPRDATWSGLSWAPSPVYRNGKFYLYFGNGGSAIGVAVSDSPTGPFKDPVGRAIVNGSTPGVQPFNGWLFDPMTFIDDDGQAYMYFGGNGDGNLRVIKLNNDMISVNGSAGKFNVPNFFEAAWVHKRNGVYYFSYSTNPSAGMRIDYMTSTNPMSGFTYRGVMSAQPPNNNNNNHQAVFQLNNQWYQLYHNRIVASQTGVAPTYKRNLAIDAFSHRADGSIVQMVNTTNGLVQVGRLNPYVRSEAETMSDQRGIETEVCSAGGMNLTLLDNNDFTMVEGVDFGLTGATSIATRVASTKTGGTIEIRLGSSTGTLIGTVAVPNTGGRQTWQTVTTSVTKTTGIQNVYFIFKGGSADLFNIDYWTFSAGTITNTPPTVSLTAPLANASFIAPDVISITANAADANGAVASVSFYNGTTLLGTDATAPYSYSWTTVAAGTYSITARATDNAGAITTSAAVSIMVTAIPNTAPTVSLTAPTTNASFTAPATISITANAADANGTVASVAFYNGTTLLGTDATAPYSYSWTTVAAGTYSITARATDNAGAITTSAAVPVTVTGVISTDPIVGPNCGNNNTTLSLSLNSANRANVTSYNWWYTGSAASNVVVPGAPYSVAIQTGANFSSGQVCVGTNLSVAPWYVQYCKTITKCANARIGALDFEEKKEVFVAFPNPTQNEFEFVNNGDVLKIQIVNELGETVFQRENIQPQQIITFGQQYTPGIYNMIITHIDGHLSTQRLVKVK